MGFKDLLNKITQTEEEPGGYGDPYGIDDPIDEQDGYMGGFSQAEQQSDPFAGSVDTSYQAARPAQNINISGSAIELKVVKPESYKNASQIADHLLSGRTVVLNLESTNKETARRLIDFLTGAAYAIGGDIKKVSNNTYVITPGDNVAVSGDKLQAEVKAAPVQQPEEGTEYFEL